MIIIADSGSSKTAWQILHENGDISQAVTRGMNPYLQSPTSMVSTIENSLLPQLDSSPDRIYFYGAGCSSEINKKQVEKVLQGVFPKSDIQVEHDLLAAAHALCGHQRGIACILGTGANSCLYDGQRILQNVKALGFILGDEGSGAYMGKRLIADYFRGDMPRTLQDEMQDTFEMGINSVLTKVYKEETGTQYLASFSKFIIEFIEDPYMYKLVSDSFRSFFEKNVVKYDNYKDEPVNFTGSVAFYYRDILKKVGEEMGITIDKIVENPIAGLTEYHKEINLL